MDPFRFCIVGFAKFSLYLSKRLLSNAVLPEANPLLELDDSRLDDDFQRMLYDWDNHLGALQVRSKTCPKRPYF